MGYGKSRNVVSFSSIEIPDTLKEFVFVREDVVVCTSVQVAEKFGIEHFLLRKALIALIGEKELRCSKKVDNLFFEGISYDCCKSEYIDTRSRKQECFLLTKTAFLLVSMALKTPEARKWRRRYIDAFDKISKVLIDTANQRIFQLTKPQESIWVPVFNEYNERVYKLLAPMENYTEEQQLVIRKANAKEHAKCTISNVKKWEKEFLGQEAMSFMPTVCCETDSEGDFIEIPRLSELKIAKLPKMPPEAFKRVSWTITKVKKGKEKD
jgi:Rha family phage regulatory protein